MVTKVCFVGDGFTRKPPKYERFIRPMVRSPHSFSRCFHRGDRFLITLILFTVPTVGLAFQKGSRHTPRAEGHLLPPHPRREEEPLLAPLHLPGRHHQRNSGGGQCQRAGFGHTRRKSHLGWGKKKKSPGSTVKLSFVKLRQSQYWDELLKKTICILWKLCGDSFTAVTFQVNTLRWRITRRTTAASTLSCWFKTLTFLYWLCLVTVKYHTNHHWEHQQPVGIVGPVGKLTSAARGSTTVFVREGRPEEIKASGGYLCLLWCE